jgi:hypothetical protein
MPTFNFRLTATVYATDEQAARDAINNLAGIDNIDIEDGPDEEIAVDEDDSSEE